MNKSLATDADINRMIANAKNELERMIDMHPQGMFLAGLDGKIMRANLRLLQILHLKSFSQALGKFFIELVDEENSSEVSDALKALLVPQAGKTNLHSTQRIKLLLRGRTARELEFTVVSSGAASDFNIVVVDDVTDQKARDAEREKKWKMEAAEAVVGALMHNINQPLTVITIRSQLLLMSLSKEKQNPEELKHGLEDIVNLTMQVAETLRQAQTFNDFITVPYSADAEIVDLHRSTGEAG